jgi:hypothetical protein
MIAIVFFLLFVLIFLPFIIQFIIELALLTWFIGIISIAIRWIGGKK